MNIFQIPVSTSKGNEKRISFARLKKLKYPALFVAMLALCILFAFMIKSGELKAGILIIIALVGPPFAFSMVAYPKFGIISLMIISYLMLWIMRILPPVPFPLGTIMDMLQALLLLGLVIKLKYNPDFSFLKSPISIMIMIWIIYNLIEVVNPSAESRLAWIYTIRSIAFVMLTYFIFSYHIKSIAFVRLIIKIWLGLSFFGAAYAFKQQYFGFFGFEERFLYSNPIIKDLLFINGVWRKFSIYGDPVVFSYNMVMSSLLCVGLLFGPFSKIKKWILGFGVVFFLINMLFSGTRGAFVLFPVGMVFLAIINFNRNVLIISGIAGMFIAVLIFMPTTNLTLYRFQSAFKPGEDASYKLRKANQKMIQPFIQSHPMGGGLGATGIWGVKFAPNSFLAKFPPDSGYVRIAVELGWVGLLLFCTLIFTILRTGIIYYYDMKDPELKSYCLAMVLIVFAINIGNYPQEALIQFPSNVYFFLVAALISVAKRLDNEKTAKEELLLSQTTQQ